MRIFQLPVYTVICQFDIINTFYASVTLCEKFLKARAGHLNGSFSLSLQAWCLLSCGVNWPACTPLPPRLRPTMLPSCGARWISSRRHSAPCTAAPLSAHPASVPGPNRGTACLAGTSTAACWVQARLRRMRCTPQVGAAPIRAVGATAMPATLQHSTTTATPATDPTQWTAQSRYYLKFIICPCNSLLPAFALCTIIIIVAWQRTNAAMPACRGSRICTASASCGRILTACQCFLAVPLLGSQSPTMLGDVCNACRTAAGSRWRPGCSS